MVFSKLANLSFSRFPHRIFVKSWIPRIPPSRPYEGAESFEINCFVCLQGHLLNMKMSIPSFTDKYSGHKKRKNSKLHAEGKSQSFVLTYQLPIEFFCDLV